MSWGFSERRGVVVEQVAWELRQIRDRRQSSGNSWACRDSHGEHLESDPPRLCAGIAGRQCDRSPT